MSDDEGLDNAEELQDCMDPDLIDQLLAGALDDLEKLPIAPAVGALAGIGAALPPAAQEALDRFNHLLHFTETAEHVEIWEKLSTVMKRMLDTNTELLTDFPPGDLFRSYDGRAEGDNPFADFRLEDLSRELTSATKTAKHWRGIWQTGETASITHSSCYAALQAHLDATRDVIMRHNGMNFLVGVPGMRDSYLRLCSIYVDVYEALRLLWQLLASLDNVKRAKKRLREDIAEVRCAFACCFQVTCVLSALLMILYGAALSASSFVIIIMISRSSSSSNSSSSNSSISSRTNCSCSSSIRRKSRIGSSSSSNL
jgi:hypothetical protein